MEEPSRIERMTVPRRCHDCDAEPGTLHDPGCDVEHCVLCGGQAISCGCVYAVNGIDDVFDLETTHPDVYDNGPTDDMERALEAEEAKYGGRLPWTGIFPGTEECIEFGWYSKWVDKHWADCARDDPDAGPDLNRLALDARWDRAARRWVLR